MMSKDVMQWFFDLQKVSEGFNWHINVASLEASKQHLDKVIGNAEPATVVCEAYKKFSAAVGPTVMTALLQSDDAFPEVNHSGKLSPPGGGKVLLYVDKLGTTLWGKFTLVWGEAPTFVIGGAE
jgi:hypothetical protein